jgi:ATP-binding cassette subfamily C protein
MFGVIRIFFRAKGANPWTVLSCLVGAGFIEGIGIATLLPLLTVATAGAISGDSPINRIVLDALAFLGLPAEFYVLLTIVVVALVLKAIIEFTALVHVGYSVAQIATGVRTDVLKNLLAARWPYYTTQPIGRFANVMSNDATRAGGTCRKAAEFLAISIQTAVYLTVALIMSWQLTLIAFVVGGAIVLVLTSLVGRSRHAGQKQTDKTKQFVTYLTDVLNNIRPLKAMAKQGHFSALLDHRIGQLRKALRRQVMSVQLLRMLQNVMIALAMGVGFYLALEVARFEATEILITGAIILKVVKNMAAVQRHYQNAVLLESPYYAVEGLIKETAAEREELHGGVVPELKDGCSLHDVHVSFRDDEVIKDLNLEIPAGKITVLTGASGAGKTTVTDLLLGFIDPDSGRVCIDGVPLSRVDLARWRGMIGYVPQELSLLHDTVLANITLGDPQITEADAIAALKTAGVWDFIESQPEGLETRVGEKGSQMSGGQRQRLALARALAGRPKLLILDEITSALDSKTEDAICATLRSLAGDLTILAVSHRPRLVDFADRVYLLADGKAQPVTPSPVLAVSQEA